MSEKNTQLEEIMKNSKFLPRDVSLYTTDGISFAQETEADLTGLMPGEMGKKFIGYLAEQSGKRVALNGETGAFGTHLLKGLTNYAVQEGMINQDERATYDVAPYLALVGALAAQPNEYRELVETYCAKEYAGMPFEKVEKVAAALRSEVGKKVAQYNALKKIPPIPVKAINNAAAA